MSLIKAVIRQKEFCMFETIFKKAIYIYIYYGRKSTTTR